MSDSIAYGQAGYADRDESRTLFARTMGFVAGTAALFALGAYLGRDLGGGAAIISYIASFAALIGMQFTARRSREWTIGLLALFGLFIGLAVAPTLSYYASQDPQALWQSGGATALFIGGFGAAGYATRRDLSALARYAFWALLALIGFSIVLIFVNIPNGALIYAILGLVVFAALTLIDFQRLRRNTDIDSAPLLAASIFLDILNVFLFFLQIFSRGGDDR
jgi:FtsH-binding integral membrane protein